MMKNNIIKLKIPQFWENLDRASAVLAKVYVLVVLYMWTNNTCGIYVVYTQQKRSLWCRWARNHNNKCCVQDPKLDLYFEWHSNFRSTFCPLWHPSALRYSSRLPSRTFRVTLEVQTDRGNSKSIENMCQKDIKENKTRLFRNQSLEIFTPKMTTSSSFNPTELHYLSYKHV